MLICLAANGRGGSAYKMHLYPDLKYSQGQKNLRKRLCSHAFVVLQFFVSNFANIAYHSIFSGYIGILKLGFEF